MRTSAWIRMWLFWASLISGPTTNKSRQLYTIMRKGWFKSSTYYVPWGILQIVVMGILTSGRPWVVTVTNSNEDCALLNLTFRFHLPIYEPVELQLKKKEKKDGSSSSVLVITLAKGTVTEAVVVPCCSTLVTTFPSGSISSIDSKFVSFSRLKTVSFKFWPTDGSTLKLPSMPRALLASSLNSNNLNFNSLFWTFHCCVEAPKKACSRASLVSSSWMK